MDTEALLRRVSDELATGAHRQEQSMRVASHLLSLSPPAFVTAQRAGELMEVNSDAQDQIGNS